MDIQYLNQLIGTAERVKRLGSSGSGEGGGESSLQREKFELSKKKHELDMRRFLQDQSKGGQDLSLQKFELSRKNYDLSQRKFVAAQYQKEVEKVKYTISTLTNLYGQTKSLATKNHIRETMVSMHDAIDPILRKSLEPYIKNSPISPLKQKALNYDRLYGKRVAPWWDKEHDPDALNYSRNWFEFKDAQAHRDYYITGKSSPKIRTLSLPEGMLAVRDKDGQVTTLNPEQQQLDKVSEATGVPIREIITGGGWVKSGEQYLFRDAEGDSMMQNEVNILTKEQRQITKSFKASEEKPRTKPTPLPNDLRTLLEGIVTGSDDALPNRLYTILEKEVERSQEKKFKGQVLPKRHIGEFNEAMQQLYPDYVFLTEKVNFPTLGKTDGAFWSGMNFQIIPIHAEQLTYRTKKGKVVTFFSRWNDGQILNGQGEDLTFEGRRVENREQLEGLLVEQGSL